MRHKKGTNNKLSEPNPSIIKKSKLHTADVSVRKKQIEQTTIITNIPK